MSDRERTLKIADLFCGAGGTSTGAVEAIERLGYRADLTAINHWEVAVATHSQNHPAARHLCASLDSLNPRSLYAEGELDLLWASPECTHHSQARGGKPISDQSRSTAWCVVRWAEALRPRRIMVENVPEFETWGPIGANDRPIPARKGEVFKSWLQNLRALGYTVEFRVLNAANYGDPTTRRRLIIQAALGDMQIVWPDPTHAEEGQGGLPVWKSAQDHVIDWTIPAPSIATRRRPLAPNTLRRINEGLRKHGSRFIIAMEHGGRVVSCDKPLPTVTCAKGGAFGLAYLLPQGGGGMLRPASLPVPTVACAGAIGLVVEYYGNGVARPTSEPLPTVTCRDRFGLLELRDNEIGFRMLKAHELAAAQGFRADYTFTGTKTEQVKQIGNAVPRGLARAVCLAAISQRTDISNL